MQGMSDSPLGSACFGDKNSPTGIPDILLIPGLTKSGRAGKNVLAQEGKRSEHWVEPSFLWGMGSHCLWTKAVFILRKPGGGPTVCLLFFSSDVEESQERVHSE